MLTTQLLANLKVPSHPRSKVPKTTKRRRSTKKARKRRRLLKRKTRFKKNK